MTMIENNSDDYPACHVCASHVRGVDRAVSETPDGKFYRYVLQPCGHDVPSGYRSQHRQERQYLTKKGPWQQPTDIDEKIIAAADALIEEMAKVQIHRMVRHAAGCPADGEEGVICECPVENVWRAWESYTHTRHLRGDQ